MQFLKQIFDIYEIHIAVDAAHLAPEEISVWESIQK